MTDWFWRPLLVVPIAAFIWAKLEVEIEGKHGWAEKLPTWRIEKHYLLDLLMGGRPLTGFHCWAFAFVGFMFHVPLVWLGSWSAAAEIQILGSLMIFWVFEDFFWFMVNPHYGWRRYRAKDVGWHPRWLMGIPRDHWGMILIGLSLLLLAWSYRT